MEGLASPRGESLRTASLSTVASALARPSPASLSTVGNAHSVREAVRCERPERPAQSLRVKPGVLSTKKRGLQNQPATGRSIRPSRSSRTVGVLGSAGSCLELVSLQWHAFPSSNSWGFGPEGFGVLVERLLKGFGRPRDVPPPRKTRHSSEIGGQLRPNTVGNTCPWPRSLHHSQQCLGRRQWDFKGLQLHK